MFCDDENRKNGVGGEVRVRGSAAPIDCRGVLVVPTDISGVLNTSPTESQGIWSHYVKRGLWALNSGERLPSDLSISILLKIVPGIKIPAVYVKPKSWR